MSSPQPVLRLVCPCIQSRTTPVYRCVLYLGAGINVLRGCHERSEVLGILRIIRSYERCQCQLAKENV